jgi:hypothetical protein
MLIHHKSCSERVLVGRKAHDAERGIDTILPIGSVCEKIRSEIDLLGPRCWPGARAFFLLVGAPLDSKRHLLDAKTG